MHRLMFYMSVPPHAWVQRWCRKLLRRLGLVPPDYSVFYIPNGGGIELQFNETPTADEEHEISCRLFAANPPTSHSAAP